MRQKGLHLLAAAATWSERRRSAAPPVRRPRALFGWLTEARATWSRWWDKAAFSLLDQATVSGSTFLLSILLARWLAPTEYGAFSVGFTLFLLFTHFHNALVLEPMKVVGPSRFIGRIRAYLRVQLVLHGLVAGVAGAGLIAVGLLLEAAGSRIGPALTGFGVALPFVLLFWLFRHAAYLQTRPRLALGISLVHAVILGAGLLWLAQTEVSCWRATLLMGIAGLGAVVFSWSFVFPDEDGDDLSLDLVREVARAHWEYGRWVVPAGVAGWFGLAVYVPLLGAQSGLVAAASLRAVENLMLPMRQALAVLSTLLLPVLSRQATAGCDYLRGAAFKVSLVLGALSIGYVAVVLTLGPSLLDLLYGGEKYATEAWLLPFYSLLILISSIAHCGPGVVLRATGRWDHLFRAALGGGCATLLVGTLLVGCYGLQGAAVGMVVSAAAQGALLLLLFHRVTRHQGGTA